MSSVRPARFGYGHINRATGPTRHQLVPRDNIRGFTNTSVRRLARRGGIKSIKHSVHQTTREILQIKLEQIIQNIVKHCNRRGTKTATSWDIVMALKDTPGMLALGSTGIYPTAYHRVSYDATTGRTYIHETVKLLEPAARPATSAAEKADDEVEIDGDSDDSHVKWIKEWRADVASKGNPAPPPRRDAQEVRNLTNKAFECYVQGFDPDTGEPYASDTSDSSIGGPVTPRSWESEDSL